MACHINNILLLTCMNNSTPKYTLYIQTPLGTDIDGTPCKETDKWSYADAVGMLQFLSSNERLDIKLATNQISRQTHNPNLSQEIKIMFILQ